MSGKWRGSSRGQRLPGNWPKLIKVVRTRSGGQCEFILPSGKRCPRKGDGGIDHIIAGDDHSLSNLRDSCQAHHGAKSAQEGNDAREELAALRKRPAEQGFITPRRKK
jgi:hypothetical protein